MTLPRLSTVLLAIPVVGVVFWLTRAFLGEVVAIALAVAMGVALQVAIFAYLSEVQQRRLEMTRALGLRPAPEDLKALVEELRTFKILDPTESWVIEPERLF